LPSILTCTDFEGACCEDCHKDGHVLVLYPWSIYSEGKKDKMPDLSMGLRAEICCGRFHVARNLPREWWVRRYCARQGWSAADTERLIKESGDDRGYLKTSSELAGKYYVVRNPGTAVAGPPKRRAAPSAKGCPSCGVKWDGYVCDNCGHS